MSTIRPLTRVILFLVLYNSLSAIIALEDLSAAEVPPDYVDVPIAATSSLYVNLTQNAGELCNRPCTVGNRRVCYFQFTLEHYQAMGVACRNCANGVEAHCNHPQCIVGDGVEKGVMSINRRVPGPAIQVCQNDIIVVDVINHAHGTAAAIHWHGLHMRETPFMDGVPFVTQCPIPFATTFRYEFEATEPGTHFYHSHAGHHKINGQYGALIVRRPQDPHAHLYDEDLPEHHLILSDWQHSYGETLFPGLPSAPGIWPDSLLINGRGIYHNLDTGERTGPPVRQYHVTAGKTYRFRIINSISHACPVKLQFESHELTVIASDGFDVEPRVFNTLIINSGERYDVLLTADQPPDNYWIRLRAMGICEQLEMESLALLHYGNSDLNRVRFLPAPVYDDGSFEDGILLNHPNATCVNGVPESICINDLHALVEDQQLRTATPDHRFDLVFHNYPVPRQELFEPGTYPHFMNPRAATTLVGGINNLSLVFPDYPLLTQPREIEESIFCDELNVPARCANRRVCNCVHRLYVERNSIVELVIVDQTEENNALHHPFHLHGVGFMVTHLGQHPLGLPMTVEMAEDLHRRSLFRQNGVNKKPIWKDTVSVPSHGFAVVRFRAENPGFWLLHCHYEWHLAVGMGLVLQVGRTNRMVNAPNDFPECRNYLPRVRRPRN